MPSDDDSNWGSLSGIGLQLVAGVVLGLLVGRWLDRAHGWTPWGTVIGSAVGLIAGMYQLVREGLRANQDPPKKKPPRSGD